MIRRGSLALLACLCWAQGSDLREVHAHGVALRFSEREFPLNKVLREPRMTLLEYGEGPPVGVAPERTTVVFGSSAKDFGTVCPPNFVTVTPLSDSSIEDYGEAYPQMKQAGDARRKLIDAGGRPTEEQLADAYPAIDDTLAFVARLETLHTKTLTGYIFLMQHTQEAQPTPPNNLDLYYLFLGMTNDGANLVDAQFKVRHRELDFLAKDDATRDPAFEYLRRGEKRLESFQEADFEPPLGDLKALVRSIEVDAAGQTEVRPTLAQNFVSILPELKAKTQIPVLLPGELPSSLRDAEFAKVAGATASGYAIYMGRELDGLDSFLGAFGARKPPGFNPRELPNIREVKLRGGITGFFRPVMCGGSCAPANLWWEQDGVQYGIQLNLGSGTSEEMQETMITGAANSAMWAGPR